jgi:hypothetical protein
LKDERMRIDWGESNGRDMKEGRIEKGGTGMDGREKVKGGRERNEELEVKIIATQTVRSRRNRTVRVSIIASFQCSCGSPGWQTVLPSARRPASC